MPPSLSLSSSRFPPNLPFPGGTQTCLQLAAARTGRQFHTPWLRADQPVLWTLQPDRGGKTPYFGFLIRYLKEIDH